MQQCCGFRDKSDLGLLRNPLAIHRMQFGLVMPANHFKSEVGLLALSIELRKNPFQLTWKMQRLWFSSVGFSLSSNWLKSQIVDSYNAAFKCRTFCYYGSVLNLETAERKFQGSNFFRLFSIATFGPSVITWLPYKQSNCQNIFPFQNNSFLLTVFLFVASKLLENFLSLMQNQFEQS